MSDASANEGLQEKARDRVLWLGTVNTPGRPTIRPVWFVYQDGELVIFSAPDAAKVHHIQANPRVIVTFHTDPDAEHVRIVSGRAVVSLDSPPPSAVPAYLNKYEALYPVIGYDRVSFDAGFSARITVTPTRSVGW